MLTNTDANTGKVKGANKPGDYVMSASPSAEDSTRLLCNGQEVSRTTYALLYAAIGDTYGTPVSGSNFLLPDMRARFPVGVGTMPKPTTINLGSTGGSDEHELITAEIPAHTHALSYGSGATQVLGFEQPSGNRDTDSGSDARFMDLTATQSTGGGGKHNNLPPYLGVYFYLTTGL